MAWTHVNGVEDPQRPIYISLSGGNELCSTLGASLASSLACSAVAEWRRSFGRVAKHVRLGQVIAIGLDEINEDSNKCGDSNEDEDDQQPQQPLLHTFWVECSDLETYRTQFRDQLLSWHARVSQWSESEWLLVLIDRHEVFGKKAASKLIPGRTNALGDRIRSDLNGARSSNERVVQLAHRSKNRSEENWRLVVARAQALILTAFNQIFNKFEERVRAERERRNAPDWHFCSFFLLQERLAKLYIGLGVFDEALVQYDELDALLAQFVLNSNLTDKPKWLLEFSESAPNSWSGLSPSSNALVRSHIKRRECSLLQLRNYLFVQQCQLLLNTRQSMAVLRRALPFLHSCVDETRLLNIALPEGALACWSHLSSLQIIRLYDLASDNESNNDDNNDDEEDEETNNGQMRRSRKKSFGWSQDGSVAPAALWDHAKAKLLQIGELCGLLDPESEVRLERIVELTSGLQKDEECHGNSEQSVDSPLDKLREALSSKQNFHKYYMELSELAISSYKHAGCLRFARRLGIELAQFYILIGEVSRAVPFLLDALRTFKMEAWLGLELETLKQLVYCYEKLGDTEKAFKICAKIVARTDNIINGDIQGRKNSTDDEKERNGSKEQDYNSGKEERTRNKEELKEEDKERNIYYSKMMQMLPSLDSNVIVDLADVLHVMDGQLVSINDHEKLVPGSELRLKLNLVNLMPKAVHLVTKFTHVTVNISSERNLHTEEENNSNKIEKKAGRRGRKGTADKAAMVALQHRLELEHRNSNNNNSKSNPKSKGSTFLFSAKITCKNAGLVLRRKNSSGSNVLAKPTLTSSSVARADFDEVMSLDDDHQIKVLNPGKNELVFSFQVNQVGHYSCAQLSTKLEGGQFDLVCNLGVVKTFDVLQEEPKVALLNHEDESEQDDGVKRRHELVAGVNEQVDLAFFTGSCDFDKEAVMELRCPKGLKVLMLDENREEVECLKIPLRSNECKPFNTIKNRLILRAELPQNTVINPLRPVKKKQPSFVEHKIEIRKFWLRDRVEFETIPLHFSLPFEVSCELRTSLCQKFVSISVDPVRAFDLSEISLVGIDKDNKREARLLNHTADTITVRKGKGHVFFFDLCSSSSSTSREPETDADEPDLAEDPRMSTDLPEVFNASFLFSYQPLMETRGNAIKNDRLKEREPVTVEMPLQLKDYRTLYVLSSRVVPVGGGELCRTGITCSLILDVYSTSANDNHGQQSIVYEVLAEQGVWAVCGSASGTIVCSASQKRITTTVEVMPIVGGLLRLPQTRISRLFKDNKGTTESKVEPFGPGQVYNASQFVQTHVLAQLNQQRKHNKRESRSGPASLP